MGRAGMGSDDCKVHGLWGVRHMTIGWTYSKVF